MDDNKNINQDVIIEISKNLDKKDDKKEIKLKNEVIDTYDKLEENSPKNNNE